MHWFQIESLVSLFGVTDHQNTIYQHCVADVASDHQDVFFVINETRTHWFFLTIDDSLPLPQRTGNAVDVVEDVVGGSGQIIHLRLQFVNAL